MQKSSRVLFGELSSTIIQGNSKEAKKIVKSLLNNKKLEVRDIIEKGVANGLKVVGDKFEKREYFLPEMLASANAVKEIMPLLESYLRRKEEGAMPKVLICTVEGDIHDIGKNIVAITLQGVGFDVHDLGVDVSAKEIVETVKEEEPKIVALSALLTSTMTKMKEVVDSLKNAGVRDKVKILIGGPPINSEFAKRIGADAYGKDAWDAVEKAKELLKED